MKQIIDMRLDFILIINLVGEDQIVNGLRNGTIEAGITGLLLQNVDPIFGVWEWPYLFKDNQEAKKYWNLQSQIKLVKKWRSMELNYLPMV